MLPIAGLFSIASISAAFLVGLAGYRLLLHLAAVGTGQDLTPGQRWRGRYHLIDLEERAASDLGGLFIGTSIAIAAAVAPHTLESGTGVAEFWWWVGLIPAAILFCSGTISAVQVVNPLARTWKSWAVVVLYGASASLFLLDVFIATH